MALRFSPVGLVDENGKVYLVSNRILLEACLNNLSDEIKASVIIFDAITKLTGEHIIKKNYNQSMLYCWLENRIREDESYKDIKEKKVEACNRVRQQKQEFLLKNRRPVYADEILRYKRMKALNYYRSKPKIR